MENFLTDEDRDKFYEQLRYWQRELGLTDWSIRRSNKATKNMAEVNWEADSTHKMCSVRLGNNWKSMAPSDQNITSTALHEILHILLHDLIECSKENPFRDDEIAKKEHEVINRLEHCIVGLPK
jgi:hypothetical protein